LSDIFCQGYQSTFDLTLTDMKNAAQPFLKFSTSVLVFLWVYAAVSKLNSFQLFKIQMFRQAIPHSVAIFIIWTLPAAELLVAGLLLFDKTRDAGFKISAGLLGIFTIYIILILLNVFGRIPCSCGGVIQALGWKLHLVFNLFFLLLSCFGIYIGNGERRAGK